MYVLLLAKISKKMLIEGKTKQIWEYSEDEVLVLSKDSITAFNGVRGHNLEDKAIIATKTTSNIFTILNTAGTLSIQLIRREFAIIL